MKITLAQTPAYHRHYEVWCRANGLVPYFRHFLRWLEARKGVL